MDISVIVVTYNQESTIARTLDSILSQVTDADYEIIIGDDCSTDGTERVCRGYAEKYPERIVYLRREKNLGVVGNYFDCIRQSRGRYLADCAGDDYWVDNTKLQKQYEVLENRPDVSLVVTNWLCRDSMTGKLSPHKNTPSVIDTTILPKNESIAKILNHSLVLHLCSALYRKDIIIDGLERSPDIFIDPDFVCEDQQILLSLIAAGNTVILPQVTLHYSIGHDSISHRNDFDRKFEYSYRSLRQSQILQRHFNVSEQDLRDEFLRIVRHITAMAFWSGDATKIGKARSLYDDLNFIIAKKEKMYFSIARNSLAWKIARMLKRNPHA